MTAAARVGTRLRADLLAGRLRPGQPIRQEALAERYGVSRVPLREALTEMATEGLVVHLPHRGYYVTELSPDDMREVYRLRELLEAEALTRACANITDDELRLINRLADDVEAALDSDRIGQVARANRAFHFAILDASRMPRLVRILSGLWDATEAYRGLYFSESSSASHIRREHRSLVRALAARDAEAAVAAQAAHRDRSVRVVTAALGQSPLS